MNIDLVLQVLHERFPTDPLKPRTVPIDETVVTLTPENLRPAVQTLIERFDLRHLSTITGIDTGDEIELLYHFWDGQGLTLRTSLPRENPHTVTLIDLIPGAAFYEREASEMLHIVFDGHPTPDPFLLPDDWEGAPPLRKEEAP
ncbi:MAG: NADH-quinone oxidoreductase subunit C [Anaerolineae bacterium]|jgi:NADH:ubiquinone oxidoreductase subunit C